MPAKISNQVKRKKKKAAHENYLKALFAKYGHGLVLNSNQEAPGNKYWDELSAAKAAKEA
jgi:hypothetical protein